MSSASSERPSRTVELRGKLERSFLDELSLQVDRSKPVGKGRATIDVSQEIGIRDSKDGYFVTVSMAVQAVSEEHQAIMYTIKGKLTGYYSLGEPLPDLDVNQLSDQATIRASLQLYPSLRRTIGETLSRAGFQVELPMEPDFQLSLQGAVKESQSAQQPA